MTPVAPVADLTPDLHQWFATLEAHPDRLPIVADWIEGNSGDPTLAYVLPAVIYARDNDRFPQGQSIAVQPGQRVMLYTWTIPLSAVESPPRHFLDASFWDVTRRTGDGQRLSSMVYWQADRAVRNSRPLPLLQTFQYLAFMLANRARGAA